MASDLLVASSSSGAEADTGAAVMLQSANALIALRSKYQCPWLPCLTYGKRPAFAHRKSVRRSTPIASAASVAPTRVLSFRVPVDFFDITFPIVLPFIGKGSFFFHINFHKKTNLGVIRRLAAKLIPLAHINSSLLWYGSI